MRHGVLFDVQELEFDDREAVIEWMIRHQLSRRNQTPEQISYFRGKLNELENKGIGRPAKLSQNETIFSKGSTAKKIGKEFGVSAATINRDTAYARAIDTIAVEAGEDVKQQILSGELPQTSESAFSSLRHSLPDHL